MKTYPRPQQTPEEAGEDARFAALYAQHGDRVYRFCFRLCGRGEDAEDLAQEVFVAAWQGLGRFGGRSSLATWLYRIALFRWGRLRRQAGQETLAWDDVPEAADPGADLAQSGLRRLSLDDALSQLPDDLRDAFLLVKSEGLKYREASEALGVPQGTVQWRVSEAGRRLRAALSKEDC